MSSPFLTKARIGFAMGFANACGIRKPLTSQILVTKFCNLDCKMCFVYPMNKAEKIEGMKEPTLKDILYLIDESCRLGAQVIIPFGGEPLLRRDIGDIINAIKKRNRYCILYTNGTLLKERLDDIKNTDQLVISIDGDEKTMNAIRGAGTYRKAISGLEMALSRNMVCRLHSCLIPETLDSLDHMSALSKKYDCMLNYGYCDATALTKPAEKNIALDRRSVIEFLEKYLRKKMEGVRISTPESVIRECIRVMKDWPIESGTMTKGEERHFHRLRIPRCALSQSNIYIDCDGSVYPCLPLWGQDKNPPNAYKGGLKKAWDHYAYLPCFQCASIFTIEKSLFYSFRLKTVLDYLFGYQFLRS